MNPSTTNLTLNMQLPNIATVSWAVQGDTLSRQIDATLVDGSTAWNPQTGYLGVIRFFKPDGTNGVYDTDEGGNPAVTWTGNVATIKIAQQCLAVPGTVLMSLEFYDANNARISAFGWAMNVQPSALTDNEFLSTDYYNILSLQIAAVLGAETHPPYIDSTTKDWMVWDTDTGDYVDSGVYAIGPPPTPQSTSYEYANSASGTTVPTSWSSTRPLPVQGEYSWTKVTTTWDSGTTVYYTVAYQGLDGTGVPDIKEMIAPEEATATATNSYAIGDYFILNSTLYVATAAITAGNTITPGTNCQQTDIATELKVLRTSLNYVEVSSGSFNNYTEDNNHVVWYKGNDISAFSNIPSPCSGKAWPFVLEVINLSGYTKQILHVYAPQSVGRNIPEYVRQQSFGSPNFVWSDWKSSIKTIYEVNETAVSNRGTVVGQILYDAQECNLNLTFTSTGTASNSPSITSFSTLKPKRDCALSCIDITSGISNAITGSIPCGISSTGTIYMKEIAASHIYAITGNYIRDN